jgi:catechol 2,3-dioxygenase-like lactoylglutathione lyase family enzyme
MLAKTDAIANVAVKDLKIARGFYEGVLGLRWVASQGEEVHVFESGDTKLFVYRSEFAGTNQATAVSWDVGMELSNVVAELKSKGAPFLRYDMPGARHEGDVHVFEGAKIAWLKDPDGNILSLIGR